MTSETNKLKNRLDSLTSSLSSLESTLAPLFAQTLPETLVELSPIEQAKLQTLIPYLVYDLVFIYLKAKGIDPKTHPVVDELSRVRRYFAKIAAAETPQTPRAPLDKAAASRFIKHAITQSKLHASSSADDGAPAEPSTFVPAKVTSKMVERAEYEAALRARGDESSEDEGLDIIDGDAESVKTSSSKGKGKARAVEEVETPVAVGSKRRRPAVDHFAGYGDEVMPEAGGATETKVEGDEAESKKRRKKEKKESKKREVEVIDVDATPTSKKSPKKKAKK